MVFSSNELDFLLLQNGKDGVSADSKYIWVKYSKYQDGTDLTDDPTDAIYIGIAYNKDIKEESNDPLDYTWTKIKGENGEDAYTIVLNNENISFQIQHDKNIPILSQTYNIEIFVYQGLNERKDFTIGELVSPDGLTISVNDNIIQVSSSIDNEIKLDSGIIQVPIAIDGLVFIKNISWNTIRQGEPGVSGSPSINVILQNEMEVIPCTPDGLSVESMLINIPFMAYVGTTLVPCEAIVGVLPSGITLGSNTPSTIDEPGLIILNVAKNSDIGDKNIRNGTIDISFNIDSVSITKKFSWAKIQDGNDGSFDGTIKLYDIELSTPVITKDYNNELNPKEIIATSYCNSSFDTQSKKEEYLGMFIVEESNKEGIFENKYVSSENESTITYTPSSSEIQSIRISLYEANGITILLDKQTIPILSSIDSLKPIITEVQTSISDVSHKVDAIDKSITDKVWQSDITEKINNYDNTTIKTIRDQVSEQSISIGKIESTVSDVQSTLETKADGTVVQTLSEKVAKVEQDANGFKQTVEENYVSNDKLDQNNQTLRSEFSQTAQEIKQSVSDLEGNVSTIQQDIDGISTQIKDVNDNISKIEQSANELSSKVQDNEGNISELQQTSQTIQQNIKDISGNVSSMQQTVNGISTKVENAEGDISSLQQTAASMQSQIEDNTGNISKLEQDSNSFKISVSQTYSTKSESIKSSIDEFYLSSSPTSLSGGSWSTSQPTWTNGKYIWCRSKVTYANGSTTYSPSTNGVCITGNTGATGSTGATGNGVKSSAVTYQASTSGTTIPTGSWVTSIPSVAAGSYLWTRTVITYTNGSTTTSYSVGRMGTNGTNGSAGKGVKSTAITYQAHSSQTSAPTGTWASSVPTLSTSKPYLWTRTVITYTDNTTSTSYSVSSTLESFEVGGRNYFSCLGEDVDGDGNGGKAFNGNKEYTLDDYQNVGSFTPFYNLTVPMSTFVGKECVLSFDVISPNGSTPISVYNSNSSPRYLMSVSGIVSPISTTWTKQKLNITVTDRGTSTSYSEKTSNKIEIYCSGKMGCKVRNVKFEIGNKATDWTPAPEDMATSEDISNVQDSIDETNDRIDSSEAKIELLNDSISTLVKDANGESLMEQTSTGWTFNIGSLQNQINDAANSVNQVEKDLANTTALVNKANSLLNDVTAKTAYINMATDESGSPCIELGKSGNPFKLRITNTSIDFMQDSAKIAYITNKQLYIQSSVVTDEMKIGVNGGFIWKKRANGNLGLSWESD